MSNRKVEDISLVMFDEPSQDGGSSNFDVAKKSLLKYTMKNCGRIGAIIVNEYYDIFQDSKRYNYDGTEIGSQANQQSNQNVRVTRNNQSQQAQQPQQPSPNKAMEALIYKQRLDYFKNESEMISIMISTLSTYSLALVGSNLSMNELEISAMNDPLKLWMAIKSTHSQSTVTNEFQQLGFVREKYNHFRMKPSQSLTDYYEEFITLVNNFDGLILTGRKPKDDEQAVDFIRGLDSRFNDFHIYLNRQLNVASVNGFTHPITLAAAYQLVMQFIQSDPLYRSTLQNNIQMPVNKTTQKKKVDIQEPPTPPRKNKHNGKETKSDKKIPSRPCKHCNGLHYDNQCSIIKESKPVDSKSKKSIRQISVVRRSSCVPNELCLDTQAGISIVHDAKLLKNIKKCEPIEIEGITGNTLTVNQCGTLDPFGVVYFDERASANVLSCAQIAKLYRIQFTNNANTICVYLEDGVVMNFNNTNDVYNHSVISNQKEVVNITTVTESESHYSRRDISKAKDALLLLEKLSYPSRDVVAKMINDGFIVECDITATDIDRALTIYGQPQKALQGKFVNAPAKRTLIPTNSSSPMNFSLYLDLLFLNSNPYLITVSEPYSFTIITELQSKGFNHIKDSVVNHVSHYSGKRHTVTNILSDNESGVKSCKLDLQTKGIQIDSCTPERHVHVVERKIRHFKEKLRCVVNGLPYRLPRKLLPRAADYATFCVNVVPSLSGVVTPPNELVNGVKLNYNKHLRIAFGQLVHVQVPKDWYTKNSMGSRTTAAIALLPGVTPTGGCIFWLIHFNREIVRDTWQEIPATDELIKTINAYDSVGEITVARGFVPKVINDDDDAVEDVSIDSRSADSRSVVDIGHRSEIVTNAVPNTTVTNVVPNTTVNIVPDVVPNGSSSSVNIGLNCGDSVVEVEKTAESHRDEVSNDQLSNNTSMQSNNINDSLATPSHIMTNNNTQPRHHPMKLRNKPHSEVFHMTLKQAKKKWSDDGVIPPLTKEVQTILDKKSFQGVLLRDLSSNERSKIIFANTIFDEKTNESGQIIKRKGRIVANGSQQSRDLYDDCSSSTVSSSAMMVIAGVAAREKRHVVTADITAAYLNAPMEEDVYLSLPPLVAQIVCDLDSSFKQFRNGNGGMIVKLLKALYGCVESSKLWFGHISNCLTTYGFKQNVNDLCVFNKWIGNKQLTVILHVDDLMITCVDERQINLLIKYLEKHYGKLSVNRGLNHQYLGLNFEFDIKDRCCYLSANKYILQILDDYNVRSTRTTPATANLFKVDASEELDDTQRQEFHTTVAKLLYLARKVQPAILTAVNFLSSRVSKPTKSDLSKLYRVLMYLKGNLHFRLKLNIGPKYIVKLYCDASHAVHTLTSRGQTGAVIFIGGCPIFWKSNRQKMAAKSSSESEILAVSDCISQFVWLKNFLEDQDIKLCEYYLMGDNEACFNMISKNYHTSESTRHINIRKHFIKDILEENKIKLIKVPTDTMIADVFTKPLQGSLFNYHVSQFTGVCCN